MPDSRKPRSHRRYLAARWLVSASVVFALTGLAPGGAPPARPYDRADAESVRRTAREILQSKEFAQPRDQRNLLAEWLAKMTDWDWSGNGEWAEVVYTILLIVAAAAIALIVLHLVWSIVTHYRSGGRGAGDDSAVPHFQAMCLKPYNELVAMMARHRDAGRFREAIGLMMAAMLRWLGDAKVVHVDESKTNGDYVREYPPARAGREPFQTFSLAFDRRIYADRTCRDADYQHMISLFEATQNDVRAKQ